MPNWCDNHVNLNHADPAMISKVKAAIENKTLFNSFIPQPDNAEDWYIWRVENWGTKWEANGIDIDLFGENNIYFTMLTAWDAPITFYEKLVELGFQVDARYFESGVMFTGIFTNENGDEHYDLSDKDYAWIETNLPEELDSDFGILDLVKEWENLDEN